MGDLLVTTENLEKYLSGVFETELNIFVQKKTLKRMENTYAALGKYNKIYKPSQRSANVNVSDYMFMVGAVIAVITAIIGAIVEYVGSSGGFWHLILSGIVGIVYGIMGFIAGGLTIGTAVGLFVLNSEKDKLKQEHTNALAEYDKKVKNDSLRVKRELNQKKTLETEIIAMRSRLKESQNNLARMYAYNILNPDYQNIYAVSSIHGYIVKGRTKGLTFNENTGDQGAYNIYEYERRMNMIITNTEEILNRLDEVVDNQYELAMGLRQANGRINSLCSDVNVFMKRTANSLNSIERCQSVIAYNSEVAKNELAFMNWMSVIGY